MKKDLYLRGCLAVLTLWLTACPSTEEPSPEPPTPSCAEPTGAPVDHQGTVSTAQTWSASSVHVISYNLTLAAPVTVEGCAVVRVAAGASVLVDEGGSLLSVGTADKPVRFEPSEQGKPWGQIRLQAPGKARLSYTTLTGGGASSFLDGTIYLGNSTVLPGARLLFVDHVTISNSSSPGVYLAGTTGFIDGSSELTITGAGSTARPEPLALNPNALGTLPSGHYTGNHLDQIFVSSNIASSSIYYLGQDATVKDLGVPYRMDGLQVGDSTTQATLSVEPGVEMRFEPATTLYIYDGKSALSAVGTNEKPVRFTSGKATPAPGDWTGVRFKESNPKDRLDHVQVLYAGGDCQCSGFGCNYVHGTFAVDSAILLFKEPSTAFITQTRIEHSAGHGILRGWSGSPSTSFLGSNTFADVAGCTETLPKDVNGNCPADPPCPKSP